VGHARCIRGGLAGHQQGSCTRSESDRVNLVRPGGSDTELWNDMKPNERERFVGVGCERLCDGQSSGTGSFVAEADCPT